MNIYVRSDNVTAGWAILSTAKPKEQDIAKRILWQPEHVWSILGAWWDGEGELETIEVLNDSGGMNTTYYHADHIQQRRPGDKFVVVADKRTKAMWRKSIGSGAITGGSRVLWQPVME